MYIEHDPLNKLFSLCGEHCTDPGHYIIGPNGPKCQTTKAIWDVSVGNITKEFNALTSYTKMIACKSFILFLCCKDANTLFHNIDIYMDAK